MGDSNTREAVSEVLREWCPLRELLTSKPCPYFGVSKSCRDCTYTWMSIADKVTKLIEKRRTSYEQAQERTKTVSADLRDTKDQNKDLRSILFTVGSVIQAAGEAIHRSAKEDDTCPEDPEEGKKGEDKGEK